MVNFVLTETDVYDARGFVESLMWDRCIVRHQSGETMNPNTGKITPTYDVVYGDPVDGGPCRFKMISQIGVSSALDRNLVDQGITIVRGLLHLPVDSVGVQVEDKVEMVLSLDPQLDTGMIFRVDSPYPGQTQAAVRRLWLELVV
jgi:hypothetical protein